MPPTILRSPRLLRAAAAAALLGAWLSAPAWGQVPTDMLPLTIYRVSGTCGSGHVASLHEAIVRESFDEYTAVKTVQVSKHGILAIGMRPDIAAHLLGMLGVHDVAAGCQDVLNKSRKALVWDR